MKSIFGLGLTATVLVALTFTNCKKDDEENDPIRAGVLNEKTGLRVAQCTSPAGNVYKYFYKSNGWVEQIECSCDDGTSETYDFSYNPNKITMTLYDEQGYPEMADDIATNYTKNGYLSDIEWITESTGEYNNYEFEVIANVAESFSYDGNGHLIGIKEIMKLESEYKELGTKVEEVTEDIFTLVWNDGKLQKIVYEENDEITTSGGTLAKEKKTSTKETSTMTFAYSNSTKNVWEQWSQSLALMFAIEENEAEMFAYIGLLGKGSSELPSKATYTCKIVETSETGKKTTTADGTETCNFGYTLNKANSLYSSTINGEKYSFGYDYAEVASAVHDNALKYNNKLMNSKKTTIKNKAQKIAAKLRDF